MTNAWSTSNVAGTIGGVMVGLLAASPLSARLEQAAASYDFAPSRAYSFSGDALGSSGGVAPAYRSERFAVLGDVGAAAAVAFEQVAQAQVPLDADFAQVIAARIWDLYQE